MIKLLSFLKGLFGKKSKYSRNIKQEHEDYMQKQLDLRKTQTPEGHRINSSPGKKFRL